MNWILVSILILSFPSYAEDKCKSSFNSKKTGQKQAKDISKKTGQKQAKDISKKTGQGILDLISKTLVLPRIADLSKYLKTSKKELIEEIGPKISKEVWEKLLEENPNYLIKLRKDIARAFISSIRDNDVIWKNKTPDIKRLYDVYVKKHLDNQNIPYPKSLGTEHHLSAMLGNNIPAKKLNGKVQVIFPEGMLEVEALAKTLTPSAFVNYIDTNLFSLKSDQETAEMILRSNGAIVSTVIAGIPTNKDFFESLLSYGEKKGVPIVLLPVNGQTEGIDPYLLTMPKRVRIVTHTIELSDYLRIWAIPVMPKNANPLASLDTYSQGKRGQSQIIGSPQQRYAVVATADNKDITHGLWSPGSVTQNLYPSQNPASLRVSELAKNRHVSGALILELADKKSGANEVGTPGFFHVRPIKYFDHRKQNGSFGFLDLNYLYSGDKQIKQNIDTLVVGDLHDYNANQILLEVYEDIIRENGIKTFVLHDALDGNSHNHHEADRLNSKLDKYRAGDLNIQTEIQGLVQTLNGFLHKFPKLNIILVDSNHHYWIKRLLDDPDSIKDMANRAFLVELLFAQNILGLDVFEYLFNGHREDLHKGLDPRISLKMKKDSIYIADPNRIKVLAEGEHFIKGPSNNPVHLHFHGHKGANGAKGGMPSHARAVTQSVTGDSHQPHILGGAVNVGTSTYKQVAYTRGGYSSWQSGAALVDEETGTIQLITFEMLTNHSWRQEKENGFLPLYVQPAPKVLKTDNEMAPENVTIIDQYSKFSKKSKSTK